MSAVYNADPLGKSTGQNTVLKLVKIDANTALSYIVVAHNLGFVPSWARVTKLSQDDQGTSVLNTGSCEPVLDEAASGAAGLIWEDAGSQDLTKDIILAVENTDLNYDAWFLLEIGRTHSRSK